jgi:hypothetical protein
MRQKFLSGLCVLCSLLLVSNAHSQLSVFMGGGVADIRENSVLANHHPVGAIQTGAGVDFSMFKKTPDLTLQFQSSFIENGYRLQLDKNYRYTFQYFSNALLIGYRLLPGCKIRAGAYISTMIRSNIKHTGRIYNRKDAGLVTSLSFFENRRINFEIHGRTAFTPLLDYYTFDRQGNFIKSVHDLKNISLTFLIKVQITNALIKLYKT